MQKFQCLLFVLKRPYICYYIICKTVPLNDFIVSLSTRLIFFSWLFQGLCKRSKQIRTEIKNATQTTSNEANVKSFGQVGPIIIIWLGLHRSIQFFDYYIKKLNWKMSPNLSELIPTSNIQMTTKFFSYQPIVPIHVKQECAHLRMRLGRNFIFRMTETRKQKFDAFSKRNKRTQTNGKRKRNEH